MLHETENPRQNWERDCRDNRASSNVMLREVEASKGHHQAIAKGPTRVFGVAFQALGQAQASVRRGGPLTGRHNSRLGSAA